MRSKIFLDEVFIDVRAIDMCARAQNLSKRRDIET